MRPRRLSPLLRVVLILGTPACGGGRVEYGSAVDAAPDAPPANPMPGFSWVIGGELAGMPRPGQSRTLEEDLLFLRERGIDLLVSLTEEPLDEAALREVGIASLHIPIVDFTAPTMEQMAVFSEAVDLRTASGDPVGVHCGGGLGRTGTMIAAYFVWQGESSKRAIARIRALRPGSIETEEQERAVADFEIWLSAR